MPASSTMSRAMMMVRVVLAVLQRASRNAVTPFRHGFDAGHRRAATGEDLEDEPE